jgi:Domain of unknown function (DUF4345)
MITKHLSKNIHLLLSVSIVIPIAFVYGFSPNYLFDIQINSIDEANVFKAIMGIYLCFASFWIIGIIKPNYWKAATISNVLFMLGLAFGRLISMLFDGIPSALFVIGTVGELIIGFYSLYLIQKKRA